MDARVRAYRFDQFVLNLERGCLQRTGLDLPLRPKAFAVLRYLVERAGKLVSKDELVASVWPNVIVSDDALAQCILEIRRLVADGDPQLIKTVPRRGYMFVGEVAPVVERDAKARTPPGMTARESVRPTRLAIAGLAISLTTLVASSVPGRLGGDVRRHSSPTCSMALSALTTAPRASGSMASATAYSKRSTGRTTPATRATKRRASSSSTSAPKD